MKKKTCFYQVVGFNDQWLMAFGIPLISVLVSLLLFNSMAIERPLRFMAFCFPMSLIYTSLFWFGMRWFYLQVKLRYPAFGDTVRRLIWMIPAFFILYFLIKILDIGILSNIFRLKDSEPPNRVVEFVASFVMCALVMTIYEGFSIFLLLQRAIAEKTELERQNVESQLEGLRNQVNPHFLFNSLNTLTYLIPEDPNRAVRFVQQLSKVYRYVLESRDARLIPLHDELDFLNSYIFLLRERFGNNLVIELKDLESQASMAIVPLTLQMLFENAIKHNIISTEKPLKIEVFSENDRLIVRNNLQRKNQVMYSTGVGLDNIRTRYKLLTGNEVDVIVSHHFYTVVLPLVPVPEMALAI